MFAYFLSPPPHPLQEITVSVVLMHSDCVTGYSGPGLAMGFYLTSVINSDEWFRCVGSYK